MISVGLICSKSSSAAVRTGLRPVKAHVTMVRFDYNSKSSSAAVRTGLRSVNTHVTLVHFDYNSKSSSAAVRTVRTAADDDFE